MLFVWGQGGIRACAGLRMGHADLVHKKLMDQLLTYLFKNSQIYCGTKGATKVTVVRMPGIQPNFAV